MQIGEYVLICLYNNSSTQKLLDADTLETEPLAPLETYANYIEDEAAFLERRLVEKS